MDLFVSSFKSGQTSGQQTSKRLKLVGPTHHQGIRQCLSLTIGLKWLSRPIFVYFRHFHITIQVIEKSVDVVLVIQT